MNKKGNILFGIAIVVVLFIALFFVANFAGLLSIFGEPEGGVFVNQLGTREFNEGDILNVAGGVTVNQGENFPVGSAIWIDGELCRVDTSQINNLIRVIDGTATLYGKEFLGFNDFNRLGLGSKNIVRTCSLESGYHKVKAVNARVLKYPGGIGYLDRGDDDVYWTIEQTIFVIPSQLATTTTTLGSTSSNPTASTTTTTLLSSGNNGNQNNNQQGQEQKSFIVEAWDWVASFFGDITLV